jgi:hypothetical protein
MNWKVKVTIGEVSAEMEIPLTERSHIDVNSDGTAKKTLDIVEDITNKLLKVSLDFENGKPKAPVSKKFIRKNL